MEDMINNGFRRVLVDEYKKDRDLEHADTKKILKQIKKKKFYNE